MSNTGEKHITKTANKLNPYRIVICINGRAVFFGQYKDLATAKQARDAILKELGPRRKPGRPVMSAEDFVNRAREIANS